MIHKVRGTHDQSIKPMKTKKLNLSSHQEIENQHYVEDFDKLFNYQKIIQGKEQSLQVTQVSKNFDLQALQTEIIKIKDQISQFTNQLVNIILDIQNQQHYDLENLETCTKNYLDYLNQAARLIEGEINKQSTKQNNEFQTLSDAFVSDRLPQSEDYFGYYKDYGVFYQDGDENIRTAQISPDEQHLVICSQKHLQIWNLISKEWIDTIIYPNQLTAVNFFNGSILAVGDDQGEISTLSDYNRRSIQYQIHNGDIYYLLFKNINQIFSCSKDNTIKFTDLNKGQLLNTIEYICPCISGFDYNNVKDIIIAPNDNFVSIWKSDQKTILIKSGQIFDREFAHFIQVIFSKDGNQAVINLNDQGKIFILGINMDSKQITIDKTIYTYESIYNISFCLETQAILYIDQRYYELVNIKQHEKVIGTLFQYTNIPFLNYQLDSLNYLMTIYGCQVFIQKRQSL